MNEAALQDVGKTGYIVRGIWGEGFVEIYLPDSKHNCSYNNYNGEQVTWSTEWENVIPLGQLQFNFMYEE
jgi:hypothetical protein